MGNSSTTKEERIYNREKTASSINGAGKLDIYMQKNQTVLLSHTMHKKKKNPPVYIPVVIKIN